jgi:hypothetical protein
MENKERKRKIMNVLLALLCIIIFAGLLLYLFLGDPLNNFNFDKNRQDIFAYAAEEEAETTSTTENTPAPEENKTFLGRVNAWFKENLPEVLGSISVALSSIFLGAIVPFLKKRIKKYGESIDNSARISGEVVDIVNEQLDKYEEIDKKLESTQLKDEQREQSIEDLKKAVEALLAIVTTVYANSKNLPQGYKDIVAIKYAEALKILKSEGVDINASEQAES